MQGEAKPLPSCASRWVFGCMNKPVGVGIRDSCTHPNNFSAIRAGYPPTKEAKLTRESVGLSWYHKQSDSTLSRGRDAFRQQLWGIYPDLPGLPLP